jgi:exodeoxyribonuclease VII large subunit
MENKALSLSALLGAVKEALKNALPPSWWIIAEISEMKVNYSGHCYLELIEKNENNESVRAKARATIWSSIFRMLQPYFETTTQTHLSAGLKVMVKVSAEFHELYGFSLNITDIEPSFTIGELARQKLEIIRRLKAEGVFDMNRSLPMPELPGNIAIISSKTAAGFGDFLHQITHNEYGYRFHVKLFQAIMQGKEAEQSIINALDKIYAVEQQYDVVVLIRGGGSQTDLSCFNNYWLNLNICQFPLPVLTGIGHEQDETIADMVAFRRLKTPTAVAEFLIGYYRMAEEAVNERSASLYDLVSGKVKHEQERLRRTILLLRPAIKERLAASSNRLLITGMKMKTKTNQLLSNETNVLLATRQRLRVLVRELLNNRRHELEMQEKKNTYLDPFIILKRGYSITYHQGRAIKNADEIKTNDIIETRLASGNIKSKTI